MAKKYEIPEFLGQYTSQSVYERWLRAKAQAHVRRDKKRGHQCTAEQYRIAIHAAVVASEGNDAYTGEKLHWNLLSKYRNEDSKKGRHKYKAKFGLLPTVDHVSAASRSASFRICGWRTNDSKHDLSIEEFITLCQRVVQHAGFHVEKRS